MQPIGAESTARAENRSFPDPSMTLIEFSTSAIGVLLAGTTERDAVNRRIVLRKVAYVRIEPKGWGAAAYPEVWVQQDAAGLFTAIDAKSGKVFRHPSRRRYEVAFLNKDVFECGIQCVKERNAGPLYDLICVTLGGRPEFSIESGCLLAPDDYAEETTYTTDEGWTPLPPAM